MNRLTWLLASSSEQVLFALCLCIALLRDLAGGSRVSRLRPALSARTTTTPQPPSR